MSRHTAALAAVSITSLAAAAVPVVAQASPTPERVGSYVVVLSSAAGAPGAEARRLSSQYGGDVGFVYRHALRGFVLTASPSAASALERSPRVDYVEAVSSVSAAEQVTPTGVRRTFAPANTALDIDQTDDLRVDADVAVLDTGIDLDHPDLNVADDTSCLNVLSVSSCGGSGDDNQGHGTHVAGSAAALDNGAGVVGMAPGARLWSVKVLDSRGSGSNAGVAAGLDWVVQHNAAPGTEGDIEVANLSLSGGKSAVMDDAVARAVQAGVTVVVAAGNSTSDASGYSPASAPSAITVSALADYDGAPGGGAAYTCYADIDDTLAGYSNYGSVVDIIAPGTCIRSTTMGGTYGTKSGTSMASPHVAGAAALLRSRGMTHAETETALTSEGNLDWAGDRADNDKEPLLDVSDASVFAPTLVQTAPTGPTPPPAGATFAGSATSQGSSWTATIAVTNGATGTTYSGTWNDGSAGSCFTGGSTGCQITKSRIAKKVASVTWTLNGSATKVVVTKP